MALVVPVRANSLQVRCHRRLRESEPCQTGEHSEDVGRRIRAPHIVGQGDTVRRAPSLPCYGACGHTGRWCPHVGPHVLALAPPWHGGSGTLGRWDAYSGQLPPPHTHTHCPPCDARATHSILLLIYRLNKSVPVSHSVGSPHSMGLTGGTAGCPITG